MSWFHFLFLTFGFSCVATESGTQYAPVSGIVQEINENLNDQPGLLNKSPEDEGKEDHESSSPVEFKHISPGWLCKIKVSDPAQVRRRWLAFESPSDHVVYLARLADGRGCVQGSLRVIGLTERADVRSVLGLLYSSEHRYPSLPSHTHRIHSNPSMTMSPGVRALSRNARGVRHCFTPNVAEFEFNYRLSCRWGMAYPILSYTENGRSSGTFSRQVLARRSQVRPLVQSHCAAHS